jgi:hypothetical protein
VITALRRAWTCLTVVALAVVCLVAGAAIRSAAQTPPPKHLEIALPGHHAGFTDAPKGHLLDATRLAPGRTARAVMGIHNTADGPAAVTLSMFGVTETDNCIDAGSCSHHGVRIQNQLVFAVDIAKTRTGRFTRAWTGPVSKLLDGAPLGPAFAADEVRWVRVSATLPASTGNGAQAERISFGLKISLDAGSLGESTQLLGGHSTDGVRIAGLAMTGTQFVLITVVAFGLLASGLALLLLTRRPRGVPAA